MVYFRPLNRVGLGGLLDKFSGGFVQVDQDLAMEVVKQDFFQFIRVVDMDGVEELGVDGVALGFFFVVDGKFRVLEDEELVRVVDQPFGAAVVITRMALAAKASQVGF
jgi:hypothetical protein